MANGAIWEGVLRWVSCGARRALYRRGALGLLALLAVEASCTTDAPHGEGAHGATTSAVHSHGHGAGSAASAAPLSGDDALLRVEAVHGGAGPWAVAGYRMGEHALKKLRVSRQSFDLEIVHYRPKEVQFSCIADGAAAATGASLGKLTLSLVEAGREELRTRYQRKSTGQSVTLRPTAAFAARFRDVPRGDLARAGREVMGLRDEEIFEEAP